MAGIDDRARELNKKLARPDDDEDQADDVEEPDDEDQGEDDDESTEDEDQGDEEPGDTRGARTRAAAEGGPALSAGLVLGFLAYTAVVQLFRGGTAQLSGWVKAKLINEPWTPTGTASGGSAPGSQNGPGPGSGTRRQ